MISGFVTSAYIAASVLFILALGGLSNQEKAKRAIWFGIVGMALAVFATIFGPEVDGLAYVLLVPLLGAGAVVGIYVARRVKMTEMPQLVAALHSFVGLAAVFIGINSDLGGPHSGSSPEHAAAAGAAMATTAEGIHPSGRGFPRRFHWSHYLYRLDRRLWQTFRTGIRENL